MKWPVVTLSDVADVSSGDAAPQGEENFAAQGTPFIRAGSLAPLLDGSDEDDLEHIPRSIATERRMKTYPADTVVFAKSGMSCTKGLVYQLRREAHVVSHLAAIVCHDNLCPRFLRRWYEVHSPARHIDNPSYPSIKISSIRAEPIPLPPLPEQKRIAGILDAADALRATRREALSQLDTLLQSAFLDMFGDPVTNPMGWAKRTLDTVGQVQTGSTPPSKLDGMFNGEIPFVTPGDLRDTWVGSARTVTQAGSEKSRTVAKGATLVCCIGATIGKMGKAAEFSAFNQQINAVTWGKEIDGNFGLELMRFYKAKIAKDGASTTLPILKKSLFQKIAIPVPPLDLQRRFATIVESVEQQKARMRAHLTELDALFASLQSRAFNGEL